MLAFVLLLSAQDGPSSDREKVEFFERHIRPVLVDRCFTCHSADGDSVKGGLHLDTREGLLRGGDSGPALVPGDPDRSPLIKAIRYTDTELQMPPKAPLTAEQISHFERWVRMGVPAPPARAAVAEKPAIQWDVARQFWSFRPVVPPPLPAVRLRGWALTSVDAFILSRMEEKGLAPAPDVDRLTLLRRVTFDLTGLPPSPEEAEAFVRDASADAFERVVDRLLASPRYGERWGRHWLDLVRYADTAGDSADYPVPQARRYRDYVIAAFNEDVPYDRFVREQIAGDLMAASDDADRRRKIVATGFLAIARRFGEEPLVDHPLTLDDTIDTMGRTLLGLTFGCARCHDHKFDPIPTEDYYGLYGIFQSTRFPYAGSDKMKYQKDFVPLLPREEAAGLLGPHAGTLAALEAEIASLEGKPERKKALDDARKKHGTLAKNAPKIEDAYAVAEGTPSDARVHLKGNPRKPGASVPRRFPRILGGQERPADAPGSGRLDLAAWLTDPSNPLTARVMVNRIWQHHFGKGIVETPSYFGRQGLPPSDPGLLDHLAAEFVASGWSVKAMHRRILLSRAYRSRAVERRRLDAEEIRDAILAVSGRLDLSTAGDHPFPPREAWDYSKASPFSAVYPSDRRSVYLMQQRLKKHPFLALFDGADTNAGTSSRGASVTSLQALFLMNSPFLHEQAERFGARVRREAEDTASRIDLAHRRAFGRPARPGEIARDEAFLRGRGAEGWTSYAKVLLSSNEFLYVD
jgi:hypothetical protein